MATILRKLARKSTLNFGQFADMTVQQVIDLKHHRVLRWYYFNSSNITFMDDILDELNVTETGESFPSSIRQTDIEMIRTTGRSEWVERMMAQYYTEKPLVNTDITRTPMAAQVLPNQLDLFDSQLSDEKLHLIYSELIDIKNLLTAIRS